MSTKTRRLPRLITLQQIEEEFGVPYTSARDLVLRGHLPRVRLGDSKRIWVKTVDVEAMIERGTETAGIVR